MKAILVLDEMPSSCIDCRFCREIDEGTDACCEIMGDPDDSELCRMIDVSYPQEKPDWCPLKEVPQKQPTEMKTINDDINKLVFNEGYNACIDEILGDKE